MLNAYKSITEAVPGNIDVRRAEPLLKTGALQTALFKGATFSSVATDAKGAERMLGCTPGEVANLATLADISDPQEVIPSPTISLSIRWSRLTRTGRRVSVRYRRSKL
jgi:hypothetical protein